MTTTYTRTDLWTGGSGTSAITRDSYQSFLAGMYEMGNFRTNGLATWTRREEGAVTWYTALWFYADTDDTHSGYTADTSIAMVYLKEELLCDCCEHETDND